MICNETAFKQSAKIKQNYNQKVEHGSAATTLFHIFKIGDGFVQVRRGSSRRQHRLYINPECHYKYKYININTGHHFILIFIALQNLAGSILSVSHDVKSDIETVGSE
ncbi:hypothetical protein BDA99DRAFT_544153 [Phascolomyces articulosus]|uniref:Uncharacterized protein n=1 Tax=Phascolomyces articulosus TaxID=60185 RepID=A0AAD5P8K5_9FUNG|nr:hypothetical protein BDA99DRAFT_544153 [Phascolomyces articulosus]